MIVFMGTVKFHEQAILIICVAIDDFELPFLQDNLSSVLGEDMHLATTAVRNNPHGRAMAGGSSKTMNTHCIMERQNQQL